MELQVDPYSTCEELFEQVVQELNIQESDTFGLANEGPSIRLISFSVCNCLYVCMHIHMYVHMYIHMHIHMYVHVCTYMYIRMYVHTYICIHTNVCTYNKYI